MSYHASANTYEINGAKSFHAFVEKRIEDERKAGELVQVEGLIFADLIGYETPAWETFWATINDDASNVTILAALQAEIKRLNDAVIADWQDDRQLHADLKRGG